jgi:Fur family iron response transcriptional regulator
MERPEIVKMLQNHDVTPTRQRIEIAGYLFQRPQHISADRILAGVNALGHRVSRATVYNTMGLFMSKGLVREVLLDRERVFYDTNIDDHHHVYDVESGELHDIVHSAVEISRLPEIPEDKEFIGADVILKVSSKPA